MALPHRATDMARLQVLTDGGPAVVSVIGKYNHGKTRLLNELIGRDIFAVADKRETVSLSDSIHHGVRWLDAPGLDADVSINDDRHALHAAWVMSDVRLFLHAAKEGELDASELALLAELEKDGRDTGRKTIFVLSQVDQLADDNELENVRAAIGAQVPGVVLNAVSSTRHRKGVEDSKGLLLQRSGMPLLREQLESALADVPQSRRHESALLFATLRRELEKGAKESTLARDDLHRTQQQQRTDFDHGLANVIGKVGGDIDTMLNALGVDHAIVPDGPGDVYGITAGKLERAHIQIAYSRACIEIDAYLTGQGVTGIPTEQETVARSLNSVMIAVMGVSVKFRRDLRRMFCEQQGRDRMQKEFARYYELSADRKALARKILEQESAIATFDAALRSLNELERANREAGGQ